MRIVTGIGLIVFLLIACGCATMPIPPSRADLIPLSADSPAALSQPGPRKAKIVLIRDPEFAMPCRIHVFLNGAHLAGLHSSDMVQFYVEPGKYTLSAEIGMGTFCKTSRTQINVSFTAPGTYVYHLEMSVSGVSILSDQGAFGLGSEFDH